MGDPAATGGMFRYAKLAAGVVVALTVIWLGYDMLRPASSSCEAIFQQTENQFALRIRHLDTAGSVVLGRQQIQQLNDSAQETAVNLKACCVMREADVIDRAGFDSCRSGSATFDSKLLELQDRIDAMADAERKGGDTVTTAEDIEALVQEAEAAAGRLRQQVETTPRPRMGSAGFREDFDGETLGAVWEIRRPDPDRWALQGRNSTLLIVTQAGSPWATRDDLKNQFLLQYRPPGADFEMQTQLSIAIQNQENSASMGLWQDRDTFLQIGYRGFPSGYNVSRKPFFLKEVNGANNHTATDIGRTGGTRTAESIALRIVARGNLFEGYYRLPAEDGSFEDSEWTLITTHAMTGFSGRPALWADNNDGDVYTTGNRVSPEVPVEFEYLTVR